MAQIKDITALSDNLMAVTIEDENGRDVRLFQDRVGEQQLEDFKVWVPGPEAVTVDVKVELPLAMHLSQWSEDRGITAEHLLRAMFVYIVDNRHRLEEWKKNGRIEIPWDRDYCIGIAALRECQRIAKENGVSDMTLDEINEEIAAARAERARKETEETEHEESD